MLSRVLEPEVMDTPDEASAYDRMDHAEVNRRFVTDLLTAADAQGVNLGTDGERATQLLDLGPAPR